MNDQRNLMIAIVASLAVLLLWEVFVAGPQMQRDRDRKAAETRTPATEQSVATPGTAAPGTPAIAGDVATTLVTREAALSAGRRIAIDSPKLDGSIALQGARFDDLRLKDYRETVDPKSPEIVLFAPRGTANAYYADFGWAASGGVAVPEANTLWQAEDNLPLTIDHPVTLTWTNGQGLVFIRKIALDADYMFTVTERVENTGTVPAALAPFGRIARHGVEQHQSYWILHEGLLGVFDGTLQTARYKDMAKDATPSTSVEYKGAKPGGWLGITDKYWMATLIPSQTEIFTGHFLDHKIDGKDVYQADFLGETKTLAPAAALETTHHLFAGAKEVGVIDRYSEALGVAHFDLAIDWGWFYFLTRPIFKLLDIFNGLVGNFGLAILLLTVAIKLVLFPLANRSYEAMSKMKKLQPEMERLRDRYKDDKAKQQQELMELYKKEKVNPLAGCLPILVQIPIFFSLYKVLFITIEMRHAPFFGWVRDLSAPDPTSVFNLFGLIPWAPPTFLHILGVWPLIMGLTMFLQTKMNPTPQDPVQAKVFLFMPVIFTLMMGSFPAGLVIYWTWNNTLSVAQQYVIMRRMGVDLEWGQKFPNLAKLGRALKARLGGMRGNGSSKQPGE